MSIPTIDEDSSSDEDSLEASVCLPDLDDHESVPVGDARRRLERYWELKRLKQEVDDFSTLDLDWDGL
jgi:hypothetical protein